MIGQRVRLRPVQKSDLDMLNLWKNDEDTYMYLGGGFNPISIDQQVTWLDSLIDMTGKNRRFIIENFNEESVGMVGLYEINWVHRTCEIGIYIGNRNARGKGYATEACQLLEKYAFEYLNLRKIKLLVVSDNTVALNMWIKLGYCEVGELKKERYIKGKYCGVKLMEKFKDSIT